MTCLPLRKAQTAALLHRFNEESFSFHVWHTWAKINIQKVGSGKFPPISFRANTADSVNKFVTSVVKLPATGRAYVLKLCTYICKVDYEPAWSGLEAEKLKLIIIIIIIGLRSVSASEDVIGDPLIKNCFKYFSHSFDSLRHAPCQCSFTARDRLEQHLCGRCSSLMSTAYRVSICTAGNTYSRPASSITYNEWGGERSHTSRGHWIRIKRRRLALFGHVTRMKFLVIAHYVSWTTLVVCCGSTPIKAGSEPMRAPEPTGMSNLGGTSMTLACRSPGNGWG